MTKDSNDIMMENKFSSDNKRRNCRIVFVPKKLGRENPKAIVTENFDFSKIVETVQNVGKQVENVSNTVSNVSKSVSGAISNVKGTVSNAQQTVDKIQQITRNTPSRVNSQPIPNYGYPVPVRQPEATRGAFNALTDTQLFGIPMPFALMSIALIIFIIVKLVKK